MTGPAIQTFFFDDAFPCMYTGGSGEPLVILPHIRESIQDIAGAGWCRRWIRRFSKRGNPVYIIGRNRCTPESTTREIASQYAAIIRQRFGTAHIMGFSFGGLVAQYLAIDHPDLLRSLVIASAAHRICAAGREKLRHWIAMAEREDWEAVYLDIAALTSIAFSLSKSDEVMPLIASALHRAPFLPAHFTGSGRAALDHDAGEMLHAVTSPTLIIGGTQDDLFPTQLFEECRSLIPRAQMVLLPDAGHGAFDDRKRDFDRAVLDFLDHTAAALPNRHP